MHLRARLTRREEREYPPTAAAQSGRYAGSGVRGYGPKLVTTSPVTPNTSEMRRALDVLHASDAVIELRALHKKGRKRTDAGYFDGRHRDQLVKEGAKLNSQGAAVYITLNQLDPQLLARHANRVQEYAQATATDANVIRRQWMLVDIDPQRPQDTSASPEQAAAAVGRARQVYAYLAEWRWPKPVVTASGNGMHLLYRIDLPNDEPSRDLIKGCLDTLSARFDDGLVKIDRSVFNAARIIKLIGTVANKGDNLPSAPWRLSRLRNVPKSIETVSVELLRGLAEEAAPRPKSNGHAHAGNGRAWTEIEMQAFLARGGFEAVGPEPHDGARRWKLKACPFNPEHGFGESAVFLRSDGRLGFECRHSSCQDKHWRDLRELVDGPIEPAWPGFVSSGGAGTCAAGSPPWPDPKPLEDVLPSVERFEPELLPDALRPWVMDVVERTQAPVEYVAVSAMVALGAALGRKIAVRPKLRDDWHEFPNLWGAVIGPPSWMKSPAIEEGKRPLTVIEARALEEFGFTHREWEAEAEAAKGKREDGKTPA